MKILILSPAFPVPRSGSQVRIFNIIRNLARRHEVTLVSMILESELQYRPLLEPYCERIELVCLQKLSGLEKWKSLFTVPGKLGNQVGRAARILGGIPVDVAGNFLGEYKAKVDALLRMNTYDIIKVELLIMEPYVNRKLIEQDKTKVVLSEIDIAYIRARRATEQAASPWKHFKRLQASRLRRYEQSAWQRVDRIVAVSDVDRQEILAFDPSLEVWTIPNPVDTDHYRPPAERARGKELLFLGGLDFEANYEGLLFFLREIHPLVLEAEPEAALTVVGRCISAQRDALGAFPKVRIAGYVEDIRPHFDGASAFVVPLLVGGGTRVKILTAMAAGLPVVSTTIGSEGIEAAHDEEILLADTPRDFARETLRLLADDNLGKRLGQSARKLVERAYAWDAIDLEPMLNGIEGEKN